jgi:predicted metal-dependent hydrolase
VAEFNRREFFQCHETLEELWKRERRSVRDLYRGILQVAVGCYHLGRGNQRGATFSLDHGLLRLRPFAPGCQGVDVADLIAQAESLASALFNHGPGSLSDADPATYPTIRLVAGRA